MVNRAATYPHKSYVCCPQRRAPPRRQRPHWRHPRSCFRHSTSSRTWARRSAAAVAAAGRGARQRRKGRVGDASAARSAVRLGPAPPPSAAATGGARAVVGAAGPAPPPPGAPARPPKWAKCFDTRVRQRFACCFPAIFSTVTFFTLIFLVFAAAPLHSQWPFVHDLHVFTEPQSSPSRAPQRRRTQIHRTKSRACAHFIRPHPAALQSPGTAPPRRPKRAPPSTARQRFFPRARARRARLLQTQRVRRAESTRPR
jgi:hypothetical protein